MRDSQAVTGRPVILDRAAPDELRELNAWLLHEDDLQDGSSSWSAGRSTLAAAGGTMALAERNRPGGTVDTSPASLVQQMCRGAGTPITPAQWQIYLGAAAPYAPPCG